jgi:hypothetical protein
VVGEEKYKGVIKSDIEIALRSILFERARMEAVLDDIWRRILAVSAGVKSPGSAG